MEKQKLLSIVIPTYNRADWVCYTLSLFDEQVLRNQDECELIVCDNVSEDSTIVLIDEYIKTHPYIKFVKYKEHVEVGDSITRSIKNVTGKFFIVFGDDDLPTPFMIDTLLYELRKSPDLGICVFNRLGGVSSNENLGVTGLTVEGSFEMNNMEEYYTSSKQLLTKYHVQAGFISVDVIRTEYWNESYKDVYPNNHVGWNYYVPYFYAVRNKPALYLQNPLCIRRRPALTGEGGKHKWDDNWGMYILLGKARALVEMNKLGLIDNWVTLYDDYIGNDAILFQKLVRASSNRVLCPFLSELCSYYKNPERAKMVQRMIGTIGAKHAFWFLYYGKKLYGRRWLIKQIVGR